MNTGFAFGLNAYGAQWDGTMFNGRSVDLNWDTKWYSEVAFDNENGSQKSRCLSNPSDTKTTLPQWGISFSRVRPKSK